MSILHAMSGYQPQRISPILLLLATSAAAQTTAFPLNSIAIEGNKILPAAAILTASGLKTGMPVSSADFDAARDRLIATGYFETIAYRYKPAGQTGAKAGYDLTFEVRETEALLPVRVEALPISTDDARAALRSAEPLFTDRMPGTKPALDRAAKLIGAQLNQTVSARVIASEGGRMEIEFTPARGLPAVAEIAFEGTRVFSANELRNKIMQAAFGQPYSEPGFRAFLDREVRPLYEAKGYMGVAFPKLAAKPSERVQGLDVTVTVEEGTQYRLSGVSVTGPMSGDAERFRDMISAADFDKVRSGAERVKEQLRHEGYLDAQTSYTHRNNEAAKTVEAILDVQPGRKYTFGKLTVNGLGLDGEAAIRKMWIVRGGEPYPAGYHDLFASSVKQEGLFDNLGGIKASAAIDRKTHVVDVTLEFTARRR